jgi:hypothetical protein
MLSLHSPPEQIFQAWVTVVHFPPPTNNHKLTPSCQLVQTKADERKAATLQARIAGTKKRVSTDVPRISRVISRSSTGTSGKGSPKAAAADVEEI